MLYERLKEYANLAGATRAAIIKTEDIQFHQEFRDACEANRCRKYNTNWTCPPACGTIEQCMERLKDYANGLVFQSVGTLEDSYDVEGMAETQKKHREVFDALWSLMKNDQKLTGIFGLNSGSCDLCGTCTYPDSPCRYPERAVSSLEAYGIFVNALTQSCGLPYYSGPNTMTYTGVIFYREAL